MLRLPEDLPDLDEKESSELVHKLLLDEITYIVETAKKMEPMGVSFYHIHQGDIKPDRGVGTQAAAFAAEYITIASFPFF